MYSFEQKNYEISKDTGMSALYMGKRKAGNSSCDWWGSDGGLSRQRLHGTKVNNA